MTLSCSCDYGAEPGDTVWYGAEDYSTYNGVRATKCASCGEKVKPGVLVAEFKRVKIPDFGIEVKIHGEDGEIPRASSFMCEECAGLYFSLDELGYCIDIRADMHDLVKEYAEDHAPARKGLEAP